eukprot:6892172-Ditylum_brightwellii.AAC.1
MTNHATAPTVANSNSIYHHLDWGIEQTYNTTFAENIHQQYHATPVSNNTILLGTDISTEYHVQTNLQANTNICNVIL